MPPLLERRGVLRADGNHFRIAFHELLIILAQLRQMLPAVGSKKPAVKNQDDVFLSLVRRESYQVTLGVGRGEIRGLRSQFFVDHYISPDLIVALWCFSAKQAGKSLRLRAGFENMRKRIDAMSAARFDIALYAEGHFMQGDILAAGLQGLFRHMYQPEAARYFHVQNCQALN